MSTRRRSRGRGPIDREILIFAAVILLIGFLAGFLLGKQSVLVSKKPSHEVTREVEEPSLPAPIAKEVAKQPLKEAYSEILMEAPHDGRSIFSFLFPFWKKEVKLPRIAIVIDDVGNGGGLKDLVWALPERVTLAVLPQLSHSLFFAYEGRKRGFEIILHQPMEPLSASAADDVGMIRVDMDEDQICKILDENLKTVPKATGINNHRGSKVTQDLRVIRIILDELKKRNLFFLDSMTSLTSIGWREADKIGVPHLKRSVFLDNEVDPDYIHRQFADLLTRAKANGFAVGIGHYKKVTLTVLKDEIERAKAKGFEIVQLKDLL